MHQNADYGLASSYCKGKRGGGLLLALTSRTQAQPF